MSEQRLAALEAKVDELLRRSMGTDIAIERLEGEIDAVDDSLSKQIKARK